MSETNKPVERQAMRIIKRSEMARCYSMVEAIDAMGEAFSRLSSGDCDIPERYIVSTDNDALALLLKPAFIQDHDRLSIKVLSQKTKTVIPGIPTILGIVLLVDVKTGEMLSIMDGDFITSIRTGAASGLATRYLARKDASTLAVFGCGSQGRTQLEAVNAVRDLKKIWVFDYSKENAEALIRDLSDKIDAEIVYAQDLSVLKEADIICTATNASKPLFKKEHLKPGVHINAIGSFQPEMNELDAEVIGSARSYFDDMEGCLSESGDYLNARKLCDDLDSVLSGEIGHCVLGTEAGRRNDEEITIFKSVGTAIQDFMVGEAIYNKSLVEDFGTEICLHD